MKIKNISIGAASLLLVVVAAFPQAAFAKDVEMNLRFAGAFISNSLPSALIHVQAKGSPGKAVIRGYGATGVADPDPVVVSDCLSGKDGVFLSIRPGEDPLIFTFQDLSLLFADGSGEICIDLLSPTGNAEFRFDITFIGGRGRFEGATGTAVITGEAEAVSADGSFLAETGTIVGTIIVP